MLEKLFYLEESTHAEDEEAAVKAGSHAWEIILPVGIHPCRG
jgi:hypothetical protein